MRNCPVCQHPVIGRSDKKFCSADCRASYHNERNRIANQKIRSVNRILRRNRRILNELISTKQNRFTREQLMESGFDFAYYTGVGKGVLSGRRDCYDLSYRIVEEEAAVYVYIDTPKKLYPFTGGSNGHGDS